MPKRSDPVSDLFAIGVLAPVVIAARVQKLGLELLVPTASGRREMVRMAAEKPIAAAESWLTTQKAMSSAMLALWSDMVRASTTFLLAPMPALAPVRRRVRANARRLTR
jgi:hypothetical protein